MSSPANSSADLRGDLALALESYDLASSRLGFVGLGIAPPIDVQHAAGKFKFFEVNELLQDHETDRAPDGSYRRGVYKVGEKSYVTQDRGFEYPVDDNLAAQHRDYFDAERIATQLAGDAVLRRMESLVVEAALNSNNVGGSTAVSNTWASASGTPIDDVRNAGLNIRSKSGFTPNTLVLDHEAFLKTLDNDQVVEKLANTGTSASRDRNAKLVNLAILAEILMVDRILVSNSLKNAKAPHQGAGSLIDIQPIWTKTKAVLAYVNPTPNLEVPTWARHFHWSEDGSQILGTVETYRDEPKRANVVRVRNQIDFNVVMKECAWILTGIL